MKPRPSVSFISARIEVPSDLCVAVCAYTFPVEGKSIKTEVVHISKGI